MTGWHGKCPICESPVPRPHMLCRGKCWEAATLGQRLRALISALYLWLTST